MRCLKRIRNCSRTWHPVSSRQSQRFMIQRFIGNIVWGSISLVEQEGSRLKFLNFPLLSSSMERFYTRIFLGYRAPVAADHFRADTVANFLFLWSLMSTARKCLLTLL